MTEDRGQKTEDRRQRTENKTRWQVVIGTNNPDKLSELRSLFQNTGIEVFSLANFPHPPKVNENGKTFEANARKKARLYSKLTKRLTLADDSGLCVSALHGRPGVYSARFSGKGCTYRDNNFKLLRLLKNVLVAKRDAKFVCAIALYDNGKFVKTVKGECRGRIAFEVAGKNGFGYDPVFVPEGFSKTFAEFPRKTKNRISHRGKALRKAKKAILAYLNGVRTGVRLLPFSRSFQAGFFGHSEK